MSKETKEMFTNLMEDDESLTERQSTLRQYMADEMGFFNDISDVEAAVRSLLKEVKLQKLKGQNVPDKGELSTNNSK